DDLHLGRPVALKTLRFAGKPGATGELTPPARQALAVLRNDARLLAAVRHPNVVQVFAWRQAGDEHYLVLQYVPGGSLADRVDREGPLPWPLAARYVADVAEGLLEVHQRGIIHRDVKPANLLWDCDRDEALLTDFGVSARLSDSPGVAGTPRYMAPEAFDGRASPAVDVYGLAASLFWLTTGSPPFPARDLPELRRLSEQGLPCDDPRCAGMPEALEQAVRAALAARPERRPSLPEFVKGLRGALNQLLADTLPSTGLAGGGAGRPRPRASRSAG